MKERAAAVVTDQVVLEYKDGQLQAQWRMDGASTAPVSNPKQVSGLRQLLLSAFMPVGWPEAVTPDYTGTVLWYLQNA